MISVQVKNGKVETRMSNKENDPPIQIELTAGITALLAGFQCEALRRGADPAAVEADFLRIMHAIHVNNEANVQRCLKENGINLNSVDFHLS